MRVGIQCSGRKISGAEAGNQGGLYRTGKVQYLLAQENIKILDSVYEADVRLCAPVPVRQLMQLKEKLTDGTGGKICLNQLEQIYYGIVDGEMKIWSE